MSDPLQASDLMPPEVVLWPRRRPLSGTVIRELYSHREVLWAFTARHIKIKYKQMALGLAWAVIQPLVATLLISLTIGHFVRVGSEGVPYLPFAMAGMVLWTFFSASVLFSMDAVIRDGAFLRKLYFPREILPISSVLAFMIDLLPAIAVLLVLCTIDGLRPTWSWLLIIAPVELASLTAVALGMASAAAVVFFRDVRLVVPFLVQVGVFLSPVVYSPNLVPARWREVYLVLNPVAEAIDSLRRTALHGSLPDLGTFGMAQSVALVMFVGAFALYKWLDSSFADVL